MKTVFEHAGDFARKAKNGQKPRYLVSKVHAGDFLQMLLRDGLHLPKEYISQISDPNFRRIVEAIVFATLSCASGGAAIGGMIGGLPGAQVGAVIGACLGFMAGCIAVTIEEGEDPERVVFAVA